MKQYAKFLGGPLKDQVKEVLVVTSTSDSEFFTSLVMIHLTDYEYSLFNNNFGEGIDHGGYWGSAYPVISYERRKGDNELASSYQSRYRWFEPNHQVTLLGAMDTNRKAIYLLKKK